MANNLAEQDPITHERSNGTPEHPLHFPDKDHLPHTKRVDEMLINASRATEKEHKMSLWQGIKLYPKAVGWSLLISTCIAMEGYDVCLLSNFCTFGPMRYIGKLANSPRWISTVSEEVW